MRDPIDQVVKKLDAMDASLQRIDITLAKQEVSLSDHIRRTALLEAKLEPVENHVRMVNGAVKFIVICSAIAGIVAVFR